MRTTRLICPTGYLAMWLSSPVCKNISVSVHPKSHLELFASHPTEGPWPSSRTRGGMRWTRQRFAREAIAGRVERPVSDQQHADERCCSVRRSRVVLSPDAGVKFAEVKSALPGADNTISADDGGKKARSPGRARSKPLKPLRAGTAGDSGVLVVTRVRSTTTSAHEAAGAAGIRRSPRPRKGGRFTNASGALRGEVANVYLELGSRHSPMCKCTSWMRHRTRVYPSSAISLSKSATADLDAQARNPYSPPWLWIPGSRGAEPVIGRRRAPTRWRAPE